MVTFRHQDLFIEYIANKVVLVISCQNIENLSKFLLKTCEEFVKIISIYILLDRVDTSLPAQPSPSPMKIRGHYSHILIVRTSM
jgi:hypothetical protein